MALRKVVHSKIVGLVLNTKPFSQIYTSTTIEEGTHYNEQTTDT